LTASGRVFLVLSLQFRDIGQVDAVASLPLSQQRSWVACYWLSDILVVGLALDLNGHSVHHISGGLADSSDWRDNQLEGQALECPQQPQSWTSYIQGRWCRFLQLLSQKPLRGSRQGVLKEQSLPRAQPGVVQWYQGPPHSNNEEGCCSPIPRPQDSYSPRLL
jgi:hypothetical protein